MAVKVKEANILTVDLNGEITEFDAKKKTALNLGDYSGWALSTDDGKTINLKKGWKNITITNASGLKYIYSTTAEAYTDIIAEGIINYTGENIIKNNKATGSKYNDNLDFTEVYLTKTVGKGKDKKTVEKDAADKGLTIDGGKGNDVILGTKYSDTIKGGVGNDEITGGKGNDTITGGAGVTTVYYAKGDGNDTITLT
ncbi:hypothetical protein IJS77_04785, partial [bacterium]|nr:hypothetical protein [bacterium]